MSTEDRKLEDYLHLLRGEVIDLCSLDGGDGDHEQNPSFKENAFTQIAIDVLNEMGSLEGGTVCHFDRLIGRANVKVNGFNVVEEDARLDLFTTIYADAVELTRVSKTALTLAVQRACRAFVHACSGYHTEMEPASEAYSMMQRIGEIAPDLDRIRVFLITDGLANDPGKIEADVLGKELRLEIWDLRRFYRASSSGLPYEPVEIDLVARFGSALPCLEMEPPGADYRSYLAIIPGTMLDELYHEFGDRLLELNVRSFLQARGKVNRGIRDTLRNEPTRFLAYNNGISATAESVRLAGNPETALRIKSITGLQVVNGGQTVASIHRAGHGEKVDLSQVFVQAKITIVGPEQIESLVPLISRYANTQNRVSEADFSANDPFHVKIEHLSRRIWSPGEQSRWFYERARGQYQVEKAREATTPARVRRFNATMPPRQKFNKVLLAKYLNGWNQLPHVIGRGGQKSFVFFMDQLKKTEGKDWEPDENYYKRLIACAIIYKQAEKTARQQAYPAYRANAVAYTVAMLAFRTVGRVDLDRIWADQHVSDALSETMALWMPKIYEGILKSAGGINVTEWCKKEKCWRYIQAIDLALPEELERELAEGQPLPTVGKAAKNGGGALSNQERENQAVVMQVTADEWLHISGWGARTGHLKDWQYGIAGTLATYAAQGWSRVPSTKQCAQALKILETAEELGGRLIDERHGALVR